MTGVEKHAEVGMVYFLNKLPYFRRLVEKKTGLEFPDYLDFLLLGQSSAGAPQAHNALPGCLAVNTRNAIRPIDGIHPNAGGAKIRAKLKILPEKTYVVAVFLSCIGGRALVSPKVCRQTRNTEALFPDESLHLLSVGVRGIVIGMNVGLESSNLHAIVL